MQTKLDRFFAHRGESTASIGEVTGAHGRGKPQPRTGSTPGENDVSHRKHRRVHASLWQNLSVCTFNVGSLSEIRTHQIINQIDKIRIDICMFQGIRNQFSGDRNIGEYKLYYEGAGEGQVDMHAGIIVAIRTALLHQAKVQKIVMVQHRALAVRIKSEYMDLTVVSAYAPGDHLPRNLRRAFWKHLSTGLRQVPLRSVALLGIDANGHVGRDAVGSMGGAGAERWTENGQALHAVTEDSKLTVLNTVGNCKEPGWTWRRADGKGGGRIDYLGVSTSRMCQVKSNEGAIHCEGLYREGCPIDHRPVKAVFSLKLLCEMG